MKQSDPRFALVLAQRMETIDLNGLEDSTRDGTQGRLDCCWRRYAYRAHYGLTGGESVALQMALDLGQPEFKSCSRDQYDRLFAAYRQETCHAVS